MNKASKILNSRPIFYGFLALLLAISTAKFIFEGNLKYIIFDALILVLVFAYCLWKKRFKILIFIFAIFTFGLGWFFVGMSSFVGREIKDTVNVVGRISDDIKMSYYDDDATVILKDVRVNSNKIGNIRLTISDFDLEIGDVISFTTKLDNVKMFELGTFNLSAYRDRTPYIAQVSSKDISVQGKNKIPFDEKCRMAVKSTLFKNMGKENGAYAYAILFGDKNELSSDIYNSFVYAGIVHLLTTSGLHVSFLIAILAFILKKLHLKIIPNLILCSGFLLFYSYLCGFTPSILRAGLMGLVLFFTRLSGKCYDNLNSLGFSGFLILLFSPLSALDNGFLMSFFCVLSIFMIAPFMIKYLKKIFPKFIAESFAVSISASLGILPFCGRIFANFNFLSFFVNLIVIPIFTIIFPIMFVFSFLCTFLPFLGFMLKLCNFGLDLIKNIADFFGQTKLQTNLKPIDIFVEAGFFITLFAFSGFIIVNKKFRKLIRLSLLVLCGFLYALTYVQLPVGSSIVYGFDGSYSTLILTNSSNESVIVDFGDEEYCQRLLNLLGVKNISTGFVLQKPTVLIDSAREIGVSNLIRCDEGQGYDEEVVYSPDATGVVGGFNFKYRFYGNTLIGLEIKFDETSVFVLRDRNTTEKALQEISNVNYDFVVLGKHEIYAKYFSKSKILAYNENEVSQNETEQNKFFSTFQRNGNVKIDIIDKKYTRRCLD